MYGHHPQQQGIEAPSVSQNSDLNSWLQDRELAQQLVQQHLLRAQRKMKLQADKKHSFRSFQIGDTVYVKIQPYVQTSLANRSSNKLSFRFFGPYKIVAKIGDVAYQLQLPEDCLIHSVFHVSQLKQAIAPNTGLVKNYPILLFTFRYLKLFWIDVFITTTTPVWRKFLSNGPICQWSCPPGRTRRRFVKNSQERRLGVKPFFMEGGMSPTPTHLMLSLNLNYLKTLVIKKKQKLQMRQEREEEQEAQHSHHWAGLGVRAHVMHLHFRFRRPM